jgi:CheY-like chemotaxis protein
MSQTQNPDLLVVEDDPDDWFLLSLAIQDSGLQVNSYLCTSGVEFLNYLHNCEANFGKSSLPCLILLDLNLPGLDGRQVLALVKTDPRFRHLPIVILTTSNNAEDIDFCHLHGASGYMVKPSIYPKFVAQIKALLTCWIPRINDSSTIGSIPSMNNLPFLFS